MKLKYIVLCSLMLSVLSCSLNYDPVDTYSDVTEGFIQDSVKVVFKDKAAVLNQRQVILNRYRDGQEHWYLDMLLLGESHSDNAYAGSPNAETTPFEVNSIEGSNTNLNRDWNGHMGNVSRANLLICYIDSVKDPSLTEAERKQYKAEAKIFRAMVYFDMVRIWGNVPLVTSVAGDITAETIEEVYPAYFPPQTEEKTVYEQVERDLLEALPDAPDNNPSDKTQMSKSVARALLAKVYAEKPLRDYSKVIQYCDELAADGFSLVSDFSELFGVVLADNTQPPGPNNRALNAIAHHTKETILEAYFAPGSGSWVTWMFGRPLEDWNNSFTWAKWITPSRDVVKAFRSEGNDLRLAESVVYYSCGWNIYYPAANYAFMYKCRSAYNSVIKFRYADILLLKAEALIMGSGDLNGAAAIINQTRNRAGLGNLPSSATANKEALLNAYLKERRLELAFEGQRWFDLVRLDKVESVLNKLKDEGRPALVYPYDANSYRLPIPQAVMDQNPNLIQNPGY
ncbi:MAG: RagB/SusD family nutrient uptake outer membrane protein [Dysgonamonadaceae bacterium]|nr:RagB/SusD family nutrient uptake outer membrane protein [Dysgonamonadaceae bacterium]